MNMSMEVAMNMKNNTLAKKINGITMLIFKKITSIFESFSFGTKLILSVILFLSMYFVADYLLDKKEEANKQYYEDIKNEADMQIKKLEEEKRISDDEIIRLTIEKDEIRKEIYRLDKKLNQKPSEAPMSFKQIDIFFDARGF